MDNLEKNRNNVKYIIDHYFNAEDYGNDNLPDVIYWCVNNLIFIYILTITLTKDGHQYGEISFASYNENFIMLLDSLYLRLRQMFTLKEQYSAGKFIKDLKDDYNLLETELLNDDKDFPNSVVNEFNKKLKETYKKIYTYRKEATVPKFIYEYQREAFHQDHHSNGSRYDINFLDGQKRIRRSRKPELVFEDIFEDMEQVSIIILEYVKICGISEYLQNCNRFHDDLQKMVVKCTSIYKFDFKKEYILKSIKELREKLPNTLKLIA